MVNNSTNIDKGNNHLAHQIIEIKKATIYDVVNEILPWNRHTNVAVLIEYTAPLAGIQGTHWCIYGCKSNNQDFQSFQSVSFS